MKLNPLKPSIREKKRYICFKTEKLPINEAKNKILSRVKAWIGEKNYALGRVHFMEKYFVEEKNFSKGIISCNHKQYLDVRSGIALVENTKIIYSSGTLKKAKENL